MSPTIITRQQWQARPPKTPGTTVPITARTATCIHHDGPNPVTVRTRAEAYALMRRDQAYHQDHNGWADIGYNYLVISAAGYPIDGAILEGRGRDIVGAHCLNWNTPWIGIQVAVGGGQVPSPAALASTRWLHDTFVKAARHTLGMKGHRDGFNTACPDPILYAWVRAGMPVGVAPRAPAAALQDTPPAAPEDDMSPFTPRQLQDLAGAGVLGARIGRREASPGQPLTVGIVLDRLYSSAAAQNVQITALTAAVAALAGTKPGVDGAAIIAAVQAEVKAALADTTITLTTGG